jgi:hypothetical protein
MGEDEPRGRKNADGSVDVWVGRRRLSFPGGGRKPKVTDEQEAPPDGGELPRGVRVDVAESATIVGYDGWYARITASGVDVSPARARRGPGRIFYRRRGS